MMLAQLGLLGTAVGLVLSHVLVSVPFVVLLMSVGLRGLDPRLEQVALTLGASRRQTILRVIVPNLASSLAASWIIAFISSFDEVIVTLFIAGTFDTIPKRMFNDLMLEINPVITAVATSLIALSAAAAAAFAWIEHSSRRRNADSS